MTTQDKNWTLKTDARKEMKIIIASQLMKIE
jgi:hypothetical protein